MPDSIPSQGAHGSQEQGVAAFFDMDWTLLRDSSGRLYLKYLRSRGRLTWWQWAMIAAQVGLYVGGLLDFPYLMARIMMQVDDGSEAAAWRLSDTWFMAIWCCPKSNFMSSWVFNWHVHTIIVM